MCRLLRMNLSLIVFFLFLTALWAPVVWHLKQLWLAFPQYHYGFAVPFMAALLAARRWLAASASHKVPRPASAGKAEDGRPPMRPIFDGLKKRQVGAWVFLVFAVASFLVLPVRVVHEANPLWRLTSWALVLLAVAVTFCAIYLAGGRRWVREFAFPVLFILVSVPWPSGIELPFIQWLAGATTQGAVEMLNVLGIPAVRHANVVEISRGMVGVDDACSGVRSVQASLMLALFLGELFRLRIWQRFTCVGAAFVLASGLNVLRTVLLTWAVSRGGIGAIHRWHDPTGVTIGVLCFGSVALLAVWFSPAGLRRRWSEFVAQELPEERRGRLAAEKIRKQREEKDRLKAEKAAAEEEELRRLEVEAFLAKEHAKMTGQETGYTRQLGFEEAPEEEEEEETIDSAAAKLNNTPWELMDDGTKEVASTMPRFSFVPFHRYAVAVIFWLLLVEAATELWYRVRESNLPPPMAWSVQWPTNNPSFTREPLSKNAQTALRCDSALRASWTDEGGREWLANYVRWVPGHTSAHLACLHSPEACLPLSGWKLTSLPELRRLGPLNPPLPFRAYRLEGIDNRPGYVFYCRSGDRRDMEIETDETALAWPKRLRAVWRGRGIQGMTVLELVVWGAHDEARAQQAAEHELQYLLKNSPPPA